MDQFSQRGLRILIVDDHRDTRVAFARLLKSEGHAATPAAGYHAALALAQKERFEVLVCDIGLQDGDGCDLLPAIRALYPIHAIAISGYGMDYDVERALAAGYHDYLLKPLKWTDLAGLLERIQSQMHAPSANPTTAHFPPARRTSAGGCTFTADAPPTAPSFCTLHSEFFNPYNHSHGYPPHDSSRSGRRC